METDPFDLGPTAFEQLACVALALLFAGGAFAGVWWFGDWALDAIRAAGAD